MKYMHGNEIVSFFPSFMLYKDSVGKQLKKNSGGYTVVLFVQNKIIEVVNRYLNSVNG